MRFTLNQGLDARLGSGWGRPGIREAVRFEICFTT